MLSVREAMPSSEPSILDPDKSRWCWSRPRPESCRRAVAGKRFLSGEAFKERRIGFGAGSVKSAESEAEMLQLRQLDSGRLVEESFIAAVWPSTMVENANGVPAFLRSRLR